MGAGRWGINVVRTFSRLEGVDLAWIADPDPRARERAAEVSPESRVCESMDLAVDDVDAVAICTPAADHVEHAGELLAAGLHVLVEKPIALSRADARALSESALEREQTLMVGHQLLFHPLFNELEETLAGGDLGALQRIVARRSGIVDFQSEPDVLWAYGPHDLSMILALTGETPSEIAANGGLRIPGGAAVEAEIAMRFDSGLEARIELDGVAAERVRRLTLIGDRATCVFDDSVPGGHLILSGTRGREIEPDRRRAFAPLRRSCRHFVECAVQRSRPRTDGEHGEIVTGLLERVASAMTAAQGSDRPAVGLPGRQTI
jgi:UDP-2-acetamido-3-amino-2,3-dideoxy-glucuronate N-acetyltransferase